MGNKNKGKQPAGGDAQKKRKHDKVEEAPAALFSAPKDSELGSIFGKSVRVTVQGVVRY